MYTKGETTLPFISTATADTLQLIALPIEAAGLILVVIEIFVPDIADRIEAALDEAVERSPSSIDEFVERVTRSFWHRLALLCIAGSIGVRSCEFSFVADETGILGAQYDAMRKQLRYEGVVLVSVAAVIFTFTPFLLRGLVALLKTADSICRGRALGAIGLALALVGILCELYQVLALAKEKAWLWF